MQQQKNDSGFFDRVRDFFGTASLVAKQSTTMFWLECRLAKHSLARLVILAIILIVMTMSSWLILSLLIVVLLHAWFHHGWLLPFIEVMAANLFIIAIVIWQMCKHTKNLKFPYTRKQWFTKNSRENVDERPTTEKSVETT